MPQVSRKKLDKSIHKKIFQQFSRLNSNLNKKKSSVFLSTLLTETEQTMLAKRLACVLMLHEGYSQYVVEKTLGLSSSTVARVSVAVDFGRYDSLDSIFDEWCFTFEPGDHPVRLEKLDPNYEIELLDPGIIKNRLKIDFHSYAEKTFVLWDNFEKYLKHDRKKLRSVRKILWNTSLNDQLDSEDFLYNISSNERIVSNLEEFYNIADKINSRANRHVEKQRSSMNYSKSIFNGFFSDLPREAVALIPYSLDMLTNRPLSGYYYSALTRKQKLTSWAAYRILKPAYTVFQWFQQHRKYADELGVTTVGETFKKPFIKVKDKFSKKERD